MKNVRVTLTDAQYEQASKAAKEGGFAGISSYFVSFVGGSDNDADVSKIIAEARAPALTMTSINSLFTLKALFNREYWNAFPAGVRTKAGKRFYADVIAGKFPGIEAGPLTGSNHQTYRRTK